MRLGAVVLAAGKSTRFGKDNKLLHLVDGEPLLHRVVRAFLDVGLVELIVVLGHEARVVQESLSRFDLRTVVNPNFEEGMGSSLSFGVKALPKKNLDGVFVCLGDLPELKSSHVEMVRDAFIAARSEQIVVPRVSGKRGHPVCFPHWCFDRLEELSGDKGARGVIESEGARVMTLEMSDDAVVRDMDTL